MCVVGNRTRSMAMVDCPVQWRPQRLFVCSIDVSSCVQELRDDGKLAMGGCHMKGCCASCIAGMQSRLFVVAQHVSED